MMMEAFLPIEPQWNMPEMDCYITCLKLRSTANQCTEYFLSDPEVLLRSMDSDFYCLMNTYCIGG